VREKENSDRLEWLQRCVQCEGLEEELVFNSMTNSLGPRKFLHFGVLHKVCSSTASKADLYSNIDSMLCYLIRYHCTSSFKFAEK
jgi:hypothetical protein